VAGIRGIGKGSIGSGGGSPEIYKVRKGDTLEGIAKQYGVSRDAILKINRHIKGTSLRAGETLNIPVKESGKTLTPSSKSVMPEAPIKKALRTPSASKTGDALTSKQAGDALPFKIAPDGVLYRAGDALPDKQAGDALAFKYAAGDALSLKYRAGDASASPAPGEALQGKIRAGEAEGIVWNAGKVSPGEEQAIIQRANYKPSELNQGNMPALPENMREVKLTPDQFQINKDGNLVIKNQDLIATFKALGQSTGAGETQAVLINLMNSKLKDE
jgi:LysM repeat protein